MFSRLVYTIAATYLEKGGGRVGRREGGREGERKEGREGGREGRREGGREGKECMHTYLYMFIVGNKLNMYTVWKRFHYS